MGKGGSTNSYLSLTKQGYVGSSNLFYWLIDTVGEKIDVVLGLDFLY